MAYNHEYPYTDPYRYNSDWLLAKYKELSERLDTLKEELENSTKEYVDKLMIDIRQDMTDLKSYFNQKTDDLSKQYAEFTARTIADIDNLRNDYNAFEDSVNQNLTGIRLWTQELINQNNQYIIEYLSQSIQNFRVIDYFTGAYISIQDYFNKLSQFHLENPITYFEIYTRNKTYTQLNAYHITYTELTNEGKIIII